MCINNHCVCCILLMLCAPPLLGCVFQFTLHSQACGDAESARAVESDAALRLQRTFRMHMAKRYLRFRVKAATHMQRACRGHIGRKVLVFAWWPMRRFSCMWFDLQMLSFSCMLV